MAHSLYLRRAALLCGMTWTRQIKQRRFTKTAIDGRLHARNKLQHLAAQVSVAQHRRATGARQARSCAVRAAAAHASVLLKSWGKASRENIAQAPKM